MNSAWILWIGKLLTALLAFLQTNPIPHGSRRDLRMARRMALVQVMQPANHATPAQAAPSGGVGPVQVVKVETVKECDGRNCRLVRYEWRSWSGDKRRHYLYRAGVQIGAWCYDKCHFQAFNAATGQWSEPVQTPPVVVPGIETKTIIEQSGPPDPATLEEFVAAPTPPGQVPNFGVEVDKLPKPGAKPAFSINGVPCERKHAFEAIGKPGVVPDDADALHITCVGPDAAAAAKFLRQDLAENAALQPFRDKVVVQDYESADVPILKGLGFTTGIQVQAPNGKPLWFCAHYDHSALLAAGLQVADARKRDPNWDPMNWPKLAEGAAPAPAPAPTPAPAPVDPPPAPTPSPKHPTVPWYVALATLLIGFLLKYGQPTLLLLLAKLNPGAAPTPESLRQIMREEIAASKSAAPAPK